MEQSESRERPVLAEERAHPFEDVVNDAYLFVERCEDIAAIDTKSVAENYVDGKAVLHVGLTYGGSHGKQHCLAFLIAKDVLELGWPRVESIDVGAVEYEAVVDVGFDINETFPMLVGVSNLVNGPEGPVSSRVWALGAEKLPLRRTEFLFQSVLPGHPFVWEFIGLPGVAVDSAEGEPYARRSALIFDNECDSGFIQRRSKAQDEVNDIKRNIDIDLLLAASDYVSKVRFSLSSNGVGVRFQEPVDGRFKLTKLALSTGDIFL